MSAIQTGCQTFTWEMLGDQWKGSLTDILDTVADAGYAGVEISSNMIGDYLHRPQELSKELKIRGLSLAAYALSSTTGFTDPGEADADLNVAREAVDFVARFPGACLGLAGAGSPSRNNARKKLDIAITFYNEVGRIAGARDVSVNVHPHSHHGSLLESEQEYAYLLDHISPDLVSFGPDTGHIVRGGQELLSCLRKHMDRITHLHLKDVTAAGVWTALGEGICDFEAVFGLLQSVGYSGWVIAEEESPDAFLDGTAAVRKNRSYLRKLGY